MFSLRQSRMLPEFHLQVTQSWTLCSRSTSPTGFLNQPLLPSTARESARDVSPPSAPPSSVRWSMRLRSTVWCVRARAWRHSASPQQAGYAVCRCDSLGYSRARHESSRFAAGLHRRYHPGPCRPGAGRAFLSYPRVWRFRVHREGMEMGSKFLIFHPSVVRAWPKSLYKKS